MGAFMAGMVSAWAVPALVEVSHKAGGALVAKEVDAIRAAELAWLTDHGTALPLEAQPRSVDQLGKDPVDWPTPSPWAALGWEPEGGRTRGTYWVEVTPDGEVVWDVEWPTRPNTHLIGHMTMLDDLYALNGE